MHTTFTNSGYIYEPSLFNLQRDKSSAIKLTDSNTQISDIMHGWMTTSRSMILINKNQAWNTTSGFINIAI